MEETFLNRTIILICPHELTDDQDGKVICLDCGEQLYPVLGDPEFGSEAWFDALPEIPF